MNFVELLTLAAIWGASFLFMRVAVPDFGPVPLVLLRVGIAALVLSPVWRSAAARRQLRTHWLPLCVVGATNSAIPFGLFAYSMLYLNAGFDAVLNSTAPLWAALVAYVWLRVPLDAAKGAGLVLGVGGVLLLVHDKFSGGAGGAPAAVLAVLAATLLYGFAVNYSKRALAAVSPSVTAAGSMLTATALLAVPGAALWPAGAWHAPTWWAVLGLGVLCTGVAYVLYFRLIERAGAAFAVSVTFLVPVFGMLWGDLFLHEPVTPAMLGGCAIVLLGTALASGRLSLRGLRRAAPPNSA